MKLNVTVGVFRPIFKMWRSKPIVIVELWKFNLKMVDYQLNRRWGLGVVVRIIFRAECNSENFDLSYYLVYRAYSSLSFFFYVYIIFLGFLSAFTLFLKKSFLLYLISVSSSNVVLIIFLCEMYDS